MKISYTKTNTNDKKVTVVEANTAKELATTIKEDILEHLSDDFNIYELALYLTVEMGCVVIETIEVTDAVETPKTYQI